jgi:hypothetical protein
VPPPEVQAARTMSAAKVVRTGRNTA